MFCQSGATPIRIVRPFAFAAFLVPLAACANSASPEFIAAITASCEKTQGGKVDCACFANALDKELDEDSKSTLLAIHAAVASGKSEGEALRAVGRDSAKELIATLLPAFASARAACPKK